MDQATQHLSTSCKSAPRVSGDQCKPDTGQTYRENIALFFSLPRSTPNMPLMYSTNQAKNKQAPSLNIPWWDMKNQSRRVERIKPCTLRQLTEGESQRHRPGIERNVIVRRCDSEQAGNAFWNPGKRTDGRTHASSGTKRTIAAHRNSWFEHSQ